MYYVMALMLTFQTLVNVPTSGAKRIVDTINGIKVRGYKACVSANANRMDNGFSPLQVADPLMMLAKGMSSSSVTETSL